MYSAPLTHHVCTVCHRPTSMWCSRCRNTWYCSPEHLQQHWGEHRYSCIPARESSSSGRHLKTIATPPPAEPQFITVSAIYFPPEEERPQIISLRCAPPHKTSQGVCPIPVFQNQFPDVKPESIILTQGLNGEPLRFPLHIWYAHKTLEEGSQVNRAIYHITSGAAPKPWCGPVVVLKFNGSRRQGYSDAGSNDLPALSAFFLNFGGQWSSEQQQNRQQPHTP